jgi:hypothetical protein
MLYREGLDDLEVGPDRGKGYVAMVHLHSVNLPRDPDDRGYHTYGRKQFPTREAFDSYDRIAYTIRSIARQGSNPGLVLHCPRCGMNVSADAGHCQKCDTCLLPDYAVGETQRLGKLHGAVVELVETRRGLSAKEISDLLRATTIPAFKNIDIVQSLLKLIEEGRVTRALGQDREMRYSKKG